MRTYGKKLEVNNNNYYLLIYDLLANHMESPHKCKTKIIPFVVTWDEIVTTYYIRHSRVLDVGDNIQSYMQSRVLKMTLETITLTSRQNGIEVDLQTLEGKAQVQMPETGILLPSLEK